ncbi:MAG: rod shape-determining protein [Lachnospiraceae bacterium]|nr:rod shape-determining protein [Lachnospiraceae bacterium]
MRESMNNQTKINGEELVFGLDIGTRNMVGTVGYKQGERFVVIAQEIREHQTRAMLDGQIHDINRVAASIADIRQALQEKTDLQLDEVCIAAAGRVLKTMNVHVDMDLDTERNVTKEDMSTLIAMGVDSALADFQEKNDTDMHFYCVGYSVVKYYLNGMWMSQPEHHKAKNIGADMIATFLPDDVVDGLYSAVEIAGLKVANLTLEPIAAIRVAIPERFRLLNIAMVDVGAGTSDISITDDGSVIAFGMLPHAGDSLTELLAKTCLIDFATAEKIKVAAATQEEIRYEDIMGMEQTITADEVVAICRPEIEKMAKLTADTIKELNGGFSPSAVFIVGGGGKIKGFDKLIAEGLGLDASRVAIRGEEIMREIDFPEGALKDSTIITPVGICLTHYEQNNNFIYITFNGSKMKLYDNNKLTVMDAAMQAAFSRDGLFPRRGEELRYTVNGNNRVTKGEYGESAHVYVNGESVNLSFSIKSNDVIAIEESTLGKPAMERISDLVDYNGKIALTVNGDEVQLPKPVKVNGSAVTDDYMIQNGDDIEIASCYTLEQFCEYMGVSTEDMIITINGEKAAADAVACANDVIELKSRRELELKEIYRTAQLESKKEDFRKTVKKQEKENPDTADTTEKKAAEEPETVEEPKAADESEASEEPKAVEQPKTAEPQTTEENASEEPKAADEPEITEAQSANEDAVKEEEKEKEAAPADSTENVQKEEKKEEKKEEGDLNKIIVIVNQKPIIMRGKETYTFVDIFDYIDFDTSRMQGSGIVTLVNGEDAHYTQELYNGDKIEVYWK